LEQAAIELVEVVDHEVFGEGAGDEIASVGTEALSE
jgi:hypothetical protein